jgi:hypothetical protein
MYLEDFRNILYYTTLTTQCYLRRMHFISPMPSRLQQCREGGRWDRFRAIEIVSAGPRNPSTRYFWQPKNTIRSSNSHHHPRVLRAVSPVLLLLFSCSLYYSFSHLPGLPGLHLTLTAFPPLIPPTLLFEISGSKMHPTLCPSKKVPLRQARVLVEYMPRRGCSMCRNVI